MNCFLFKFSSGKRITLITLLWLFYISSAFGESLLIDLPKEMDWGTTVSILVEKSGNFSAIIKNWKNHFAYIRFSSGGELFEKETILLQGDNYFGLIEKEGKIFTLSIPLDLSRENIQLIDIITGESITDFKQPSIFTKIKDNGYPLPFGYFQISPGGRYLSTEIWMKDRDFQDFVLLPKDSPEPKPPFGTFGDENEYRKLKVKYDSEFLIYDTQTGEIVYSRYFSKLDGMHGKTRAYYAQRFFSSYSNDEKQVVVTAAGKNPTLYTLPEFKPQKTLYKKGDWLFTFSPDNTRVLQHDYTENALRIYNLKTGEIEVDEWRRIRFPRFSPDGKYMVSVFDNGYLLYEYKENRIFWTEEVNWYNTRQRNSRYTRFLNNTEFIIFPKTFIDNQLTGEKIKIEKKT